MIAELKEHRSIHWKSQDKKSPNKRITRPASTQKYCNKKPFNANPSLTTLLSNSPEKKSRESARSSGGQQARFISAQQSHVQSIYRSICDRSRVSDFFLVTPLRKPVARLLYSGLIDFFLAKWQGKSSFFFSTKFGSVNDWKVSLDAMRCGRSKMPFVMYEKKSWSLKSRSLLFSSLRLTMTSPSKITKLMHLSRLPSSADFPVAKSRSVHVKRIRLTFPDLSKHSNWLC